MTNSSAVNKNMDTLPKSITRRALIWRLLRYGWTTAHYVVGLTGTVASTIVALNIESTSTLASWKSILAFYAPISLAIITFLQPAKRARAYATAWRSLSSAVLRFQHDDDFQIKKVIDALQEGEAAIAAAE